MKWLENHIEKLKRSHYIACINLLEVHYKNGKCKRFNIGDIISTKYIEWDCTSIIETFNSYKDCLIFKHTAVNWFWENFVPYNPKFEVGDIVTNHDMFGETPKGALFEVVEINVDDSTDIRVKERNAKNSVTWIGQVDRFVMCNPRAYMRYMR